MKIGSLSTNIEVYFKLRKKTKRAGFIIAARKGRGAYRRRDKFNKLSDY